jgi:23S rRNA (cytidine1920-2'-O)/16S rRNA (cytidine1409-2'-O)-methyltransferase
VAQDCDPPAALPSRRRADVLLVERGLFESRARAQAAIAAGLVTADRQRVRKPSEEISVHAALQAEPAHPWVSRGGVKLDAALTAFGFDVGGSVGLDVGASTGGFTHVLLARGATKVYAVDVGHGQLHRSLRDHPAVVMLEGTDIRHLSRDDLREAPDVIVIDASFISLRHVLPAATALAAPKARLVALIKPQFEAGRRDIKKGIVRDEAVHAAVCADMAAFVAAQGWTVAGLVPSPIFGGDGNREFLIGARRG